MNIAVIGAGTMGSGIALLCAKCEMNTTNIEVDQEKLKAAEKNGRSLLAKLVEKQKMTEGEKDEILSRLAYSPKIEEIAKADIILEAISEDFILKKDLYENIKKYAPKDVFLFTNTSGLSITELSAAAPDAESFMGLHFFNPPMMMNLIELVRGKHTSDETYAKAKAFAAALHKTTVDAPETAGFIVNRILIPMINEAAYLVSEGAKAVEIDTAMKLGANLPMGPLELGDFIGIDIVVAVMENLHRGLGSEKYLPCPLFADMIAQGRLGRKTAKGFFDYK